MSSRMPPFYCPYCGEEDLRPDGAAGDGWRCGACARMFELQAARTAPAEAPVPDRFAGAEPGWAGSGPTRPANRTADAQPASTGSVGAEPASTGSVGAEPASTGSANTKLTRAEPGTAAGGAQAPGRVALVGGGPGNPGLLTVRGRQLLDEADVVVVDRLAPRDALTGLGPDVEVIEAGKAPHGVGMSQQRINDLLVNRARAGLRVVRLKGGDPFVFGRGGEEAIACARAGVPCEVVPGVTSAVAVPAGAGIPLTHRGVAGEFAVVSAHLDPADPDAPDWAALAAGPATLVLLMAVAHLGEIAGVLLKNGKQADTPVAVIREGTTPRQRVLVTTLTDVAERAEAAGIAPPAVVVVGEVVRLRELITA